MRSLLLIWLVFLLVAAPCSADKVLRRIIVSNPDDVEREVPLKSHLPQGIGPDDILDLGGLDLGYDVDTGTFYAHGTVGLGPGEKTVFDVQLRDIWSLDPVRLEALAAHIDALADALDEAGKADAYAELVRVARKGTGAVVRNQAAYSLDRSDADLHIAAYYENVERLSMIVAIVRRMEDEVIAARRDPGGLARDFGTHAVAPLVRPAVAGSGNVALRLTVKNPSPNESRTMTVAYRLPFEVSVADVVDAGGLAPAMDPESGHCRLRKDDVVIPASGSLVFDVIVKDKWNVHGREIDDTLEAAYRELERMKRRKRYPSLVSILEEQVIAPLVELRSAEQPTDFSRRYVAFYRDQGQRVQDIGQFLDRIERIRFSEDTGPQPPDAKTTWAIIYGILGFLALVTLIVVIANAPRRMPHR